MSTVSESTHYDVDVIQLSDFRLPGGTTSSVAEEVRAQSEAGITTALIHAAGSITNYPNAWSTHIQRILTLPRLRIASSRDVLHARVLIIRHPTVIYSTPSAFEGISADHVVIVVNHAAVDAAGTWHYPVEATDARVRRLFDTEPIWAPIGPVVRRTVLEQTRRIPLAKDDWVNIFRSTGDLVRREGFVADRPVLGRHSRPQPGKWPATAKEIRRAYPDSPRYQVEILGGAQVVKNKLGYVPARWNVVEFGGEEPTHFLERIDFWVYMHHPDLKEAFGRAAMEALAAGCVAILPPYLEELFGDAALYAAPREVQGLVDTYYSNPNKFLEQSARAQDFALSFSPDVHLRRLERFGVHANRALSQSASIPRRSTEGLTLVVSLDSMGSAAQEALLRELEGQPAASALLAQVSDAPLTRSGTMPTLHLPSASPGGNAETGWSADIRDRVLRLIQSHRPEHIILFGEEVPEEVCAALERAVVPVTLISTGHAGPELRNTEPFQQVLSADQWRLALGPVSDDLDGKRP